MGSKWLLVGAGVVALAAPGTASAAVRYTAPNGSGSSCTETTPCSLSTGVVNASDGDTVKLRADEYYLDAAHTPLDINHANISIEGPSGRTSPGDFIPYIIFREQADGGGSDNIAKLRIFSALVRFSNVAISGRADSSASLIATGSGGVGTSYDRVIIRNSGTAGTLAGDGVTLTNSIVEQTGAGSFGSAVEISGWMIGSLAYSAHGYGVAFRNSYHANPYCSLSIRNSMAWGGGKNLYEEDTGSGVSVCGLMSLNYDYSWIPTPGGGSLGGGISYTGTSVPSAGSHNLPRTPAVFDPTDPASTFRSNYELPVGSPAIDAGCSSGCSDRDYYGRPRPIGAANDIGPMEQSLPPAAGNVTADGRTTTTANLSAPLNPQGTAAAFAFQVRKAGTSTWVSVGDGISSSELFAAGTVSAVPTGLEPGTSYEARLSASNARGSATSSSLTTFVTNPAPAPRSTLKVASIRGRASARGLYIGSKATVSGAGKVSQRATTGSGKKARTWCRTSRNFAAAGSAALKCNLGSKGRTALRRSSLKLTLRTTFTPSSGSPASAVNKLTVKRKR